MTGTTEYVAQPAPRFSSPTNEAAQGLGHLPKPWLIRLLVNGIEVERNVEPRTTLAEFLREHLLLTGTKRSCEVQVCGVCTVLVDRKPVSACAFLAVDADGCAVSTVEGLAVNGELHPLQEAFVEKMAAQCGFCTPGFLMMAVALLDENPHPTRDEIMEYLDGNICRCTGYAPILAAVEAVASGPLTAGEGTGNPT